MKSDAPWWIRERRAAHDADVESVPARGRIVVTRLLARYAPVSAPAPRRMYPVTGAGLRPRPPEGAGGKARRAGHCRRFAVPVILLALLGLPAGEA
ncbi:hypothetical protein [Streptosporangium roseum]|uniref:hypothetical protein n=1 Tax=Streptosporangium roseum TaxID=2001 RepID=UPI00331B9D31